MVLPQMRGMASFCFFTDCTNQVLQSRFGHSQRTPLLPFMETSICQGLCAETSEFLQEGEEVYITRNGEPQEKSSDTVYQYCTVNNNTPVLAVPRTSVSRNPFQNGISSRLFGRLRCGLTQPAATILISLGSVLLHWGFYPLTAGQHLIGFVPFWALWWWSGRGRS